VRSIESTRIMFRRRELLAGTATAAPIDAKDVGRVRTEAAARDDWTDCRPVYVSRHTGNNEEAMK
jgi:hypothetical protein